jgi:hypothetical protein
MRSERTLVCILAKTRAHDVTFRSFKQFVLDELDADLALALTIDDQYDYENPFWQHAHYRWTAPDYKDFGEGFDRAQAMLCQFNELDPPDWRSLLRLPGAWAGRIKDAEPRASASAILPFCRWLLLDCLRRDLVLEKYDRFIITRSDFRWLSPHPPFEILSPNFIWVPDSEHHGGINDRHAVVSRRHVEIFLSGLKDILLEPYILFEEMKGKARNDEQMLAHHLKRHNCLDCVRTFPNVMYTARSRLDFSPTWSSGRYEPTAGHYVKYESEFRIATAMSKLVIRREDWLKGPWRGLNVVEVAATPLKQSLMGRLRVLFAWIEFQLKRPNSLRRFFKFRG